jgi:hypothetical protein
MQRALVNQRKTPPIDKLFISLGAFTADKPAVITISNKDTDGIVRC